VGGNSCQLPVASKEWLVVSGQLSVASCQWQVPGGQRPLVRGCRAREPASIGTCKMQIGETKPPRFRLEVIAENAVKVI
jgi:hypothetical protein